MKFFKDKVAISRDSSDRKKLEEIQVPKNVSVLQKKVDMNSTHPILGYKHPVLEVDRIHKPKVSLPNKMSSFFGSGNNKGNMLNMNRGSNQGMPSSKINNILGNHQMSQMPQMKSYTSYKTQKQPNFVVPNKVAQNDKSQMLFGLKQKAFAADKSSMLSGGMHQAGVNQRLKIQGMIGGFNPERQAFGRLNQQKGLSMYGDADRDGVPNILDCQPLNRYKQGPENKIEDMENIEKPQKKGAKPFLTITEISHDDVPPLTPEEMKEVQMQINPKASPIVAPPIKSNEEQKQIEELMELRRGGRPYYKTSETIEGEAKSTQPYIAEPEVSTESTTMLKQPKSQAERLMDLRAKLASVKTEEEIAKARGQLEDYRWQKKHPVLTGINKAAEKLPPALGKGTEQAIKFAATLAGAGQGGSTAQRQQVISQLMKSMQTGNEKERAESARVLMSLGAFGPAYMQKGKGLAGAMGVGAQGGIMGIVPQGSFMRSTMMNQPTGRGIFEMSQTPGQGYGVAQMSGMGRSGLDPMTKAEMLTRGRGASNPMAVANMMNVKSSGAMGTDPMSQAMAMMKQRQQPQPTPQYAPTYSNIPEPQPTYSAPEPRPSPVTQAPSSARLVKSPYSGRYVTYTRGPYNKRRAEASAQ